MRQRIECWLARNWWQDAKPALYLRALVPLYRFGFLLDRKIGHARQPPDLVGRAILVVGNITVGGTGKTPLVVRLCQLLSQAGLQPGVVSRGYGRRAGGLLEVTAATPASEAGDEPLLIAQRTGVPVVVARDRCAAARHLFGRGVSVVIADDGLQHHRLPRSLEVCVVDGPRGLGNAYLLPAGPLREPASRLGQVDYVVINDGNPAGLPVDIAGAVRMHMSAGSLHALDGDVCWRLSDFRGCRVNAVAGLGDPQRFFACLRHAGLQVSEHRFADHHVYRAQDFAGLEPGLPIVMTEKDAVKCRHLGLANAWYLSIEASLPAEWESALLYRLQGLLEGKELQ
jgi:tetraacyldisaccharide 4'-kinase